MAVRYLAWSMFTLLSVLTAVDGRAQDVGQPEKGLLLARQVCVACHAIDKAQVTSPNPSAPRFETIANVSGMTALALRVALQTSHRTMPNLVLEDEEIRNVAAYILSLK